MAVSGQIQVELVEGIDLQFCRLMINYDMPWNPTRLEQRLRHIHRKRLLEKLKQMRAVLAQRQSCRA